ncbi:MAG: diacylglycerol kinase family protein [Bacteroidales bacterium]
MHLLLIFNPHAGGGKAAKKVDLVTGLLKSKGIEFELVLTKYKSHAIEIAAAADLNLYDGIVAAGGDGTFFEVLNGYFRNPLKKEIPLGILPVGTGNSLSHDIIVQKEELTNFIDLISKGNSKCIDIIHVKNDRGEFWYANTMGLGFVTDVNITGNRLKVIGKMAYTLGVLFHTLRLKTYPVKLIAEKTNLELNNVFISFSNSRYTGGNYFLAPKAIIDDGLLDLIIVNKLSRIQLLQTFPKIFSGKHIETRFVECLKFSSVRVETGDKLPLSPDGEIFGNTPAIISCLPKAVRVFSDL